VLKERGCFSEPEAAVLLRKIMLAVGVLHDNGIAHRDIKPENFLFESVSPNSELKLIDMGLSTRYRSSTGALVRMNTVVGTPHYVAPEVLT
jgi:calcium-dependent protein kinase